MQIGIMAMNEKADNGDVISLCKKGLLPKLPFLIEEHEEKALVSFFSNPLVEYTNIKEYNLSDASDSLPISSGERKNILEIILGKLRESTGKLWWNNLDRKDRAVLILFLSESFNSNRFWSCKQSATLVNEICKELKDPSDELLGDGLSTWFTKNLQESVTPRQSDLHVVLQLLKTKFTKSEWKYFPASVHGFGWILGQISYPFLSFEVDMVIPPALLFTDDYFDDYKILGLTCLTHIIKNVDKVDLTRSNWANVVYDAVKDKCTEKDPKVIKLVMPVLLNLLEIIEIDPAENSPKFTRYDDLIKNIIFQMEISSDLALKRTWFPILNDVLKICGTASMHWSDRVCSLLHDSTVCNDFTIWNNILIVASTIIKNTWVKVDSESISETVLRILLNLSTSHAASIRKAEKEELIQNALNCFKLLNSCENFDNIDKQILEIVESGDSALLHPEFILTVKNLRTALSDQA